MCFSMLSQPVGTHISRCLEQFAADCTWALLVLMVSPADMFYLILPILEAFFTSIFGAGHPLATVCLVMIR